ncbi:MAG: DUF499 domain-containing protein [Actinomycetota bacterium]|nr:DUF499 domain-containing protein [Actinomycetota bacterium]
MGRTLYEWAEPRLDVREGILADAVFAASLDEVVAGTAPPAYGDPAAFFSATHPSAGLKTLLAEVFGRLSGVQPDAPPVIRLETNLGGGKTHDLIAAYHTARGGLDPAVAAEFLDPARIPTEPVRVGVFVGTSVGATSFPPKDGITPRTPWGHLALALGGVEAFELVRADDEGLTAPGSAALGEALGSGPALILIDELAAYLAKAGGVTVGSTSLATQTTAFLMSLIEAVSSRSRAALVLTSTQVTDAFGDQTSTVLGAVDEAMSLVARKEHVLRPSDEADLPAILSRRLFARVDTSAAVEVAASYQRLAESAIEAGLELPDSMRSGWARAVESSYPFHPDLLTVLDKRLSTIPNFQRTRGALRLLARTVRHLWAEQPDAELIHTHHVDLSDPDNVEDLSSRLDRPALEPVIRADIAGQPGGEESHADGVDAAMAAGAPYARRIATAAYLWSLTRDIPGAPAGTLIGSVLAPGDDPNVVAKALDLLEASAWYLTVDVRGYRFSTEASLPKLVQEAEAQVLPGRARTEATDILARQFRDSALTVRRSWEDAKVPDRSDAAWLVILHWDELGDAHGVTDPSSPPPQVLELWEKKPDGGLRDFRNRLVFLVPSASTHDAMIRAVRRKLALFDLRSAGEALRALPEDKRAQLERMAKESELEARVAVCNHVNVLYVPEARGLEGFELETTTTASVKANQTAAIVERLAAMDKTLATGDRPLDPAMVAARLGAQLSRPMATAELVRVFARRSDLRLVLDQDQLRALILAGVRNGVWEYEDPERGDAGWATRSAPTAAVRIAEDTFLHPTGSAPPPASDDVPDLAPPPPSFTAGGFLGTGKADVALTAARQKAADARSETIAAISVAIDEIGPGTAVELARLLSLVPATAPATRVSYAIEVRIDFEGRGEFLKVSFAGPASDYGPLRSALDQLLRSHEATVSATLLASFDPPVAASGQEVEDIRRRAGDTGPAKCTIELLPGEPA